MRKIPTSRQQCNVFLDHMAQVRTHDYTRAKDESS